MAIKSKVPQHALDARMVYVMSDDTAWNLERYNDELASIQETGGDATEHALYRYRQGLTRYDIDAGNVREYLDTAKNPTIFYLRRLTFDEFLDVDQLQTAGRQTEAIAKAFACGVSRIEGAPQTVVEALEHRPRNHRKVAEAVYLWSVSVLAEVGAAVILASRDLTATEKKTSD